MTSAEFEQLLEAYERDVFTFCKHLATNHDTASDLYQETVLAAFEIRSRIDAANNPKSFLFAIAAGKWKNMRKKALRRQRIAPELQLEEWANASTGNSTEKAVDQAATQKAIHKAILEMKDKFRIPLILHYFDNCQTEAIAIVCGVPTGTVKSRLHKARALLKKSLEKEGLMYE